MKKITIILTTLISTISFAQIDETLMKANWKSGKEKVMYGNTVLRIEGENGTSGITNIAYESLSQIKASIEKDAEKEMWVAGKKEEKIELYNKLAPGGKIHFYLTRLSIDWANTKVFTIIVKDSAETELFRTELKSSIPRVPASGSNYWWNYTSIPLSTNLKGKIYVYVIDSLGIETKKFKFELNL